MEEAQLPPPGDAAHLLVVDDDARLRALLQRFLSEQGFRVSAAADAAAALLRVVDADAPPARVIFGVGGVEFISGAYAARLAGWREASSLLA